MNERHLSPLQSPKETVEAVDLALSLVKSWSSHSGFDHKGNANFLELEKRLEQVLPRRICIELLSSDPAALQRRLISTISTLLREDSEFLSLARLTLKQSQACTLGPEAQSFDFPFVEANRNISTPELGGLLAGDIPFGRPASSPSNKTTEDCPSGPTGILLLGASPRGEADLHLREEARSIDEAIQSGRFRNWLNLHINLAARASDIQPQMMRFRPGILHFSCHGEYNELLLQDPHGSSAPIANLATLLRLFVGTLKCVVLNSCFSRPQAEEIASCIPCVIGMFPWISDRASILFSEGFYGGLANGLSIAAATEFGRARIGLELPNEIGRPSLFSTKCNPKLFYLTPPSG